MKLKRKKNTETTPAEEFNKARATIRSSKNQAHAFIEFRVNASAAVLTKVGREFALHPSYKRQTWAVPFPKSLEQIPHRTYPYYLGEIKEIAWLTSILRAYGGQISEFVKLRSEVEAQFLLGNMSRVDSLLSSIEKEWGVSIWLVSQRINYHQVVGGLAARNIYLRNLLSLSDQIPKPIAFAIVWLSYRAGADISVSQIIRLLNDAFPLKFGAHHLMHLIMGRCPPVSPATAGEMISHTDSWPAVDRYHFLLDTLAALLASGNISDKIRIFVANRLEELSRSISDSRLYRLSFASGANPNKYTADAETANLLELYSQARYPELLNAVSQADDAGKISMEGLNLAVRSASILGIDWELP